MIRRLLASAVCASICACAAPSTGQDGQPLAGTTWRLRAIQSMDDAQGTTRVADPSRLTVAFMADGRAALRLDCNRGAAGWRATPSAAGDSGTLEFGAIAATRAMCPPPSLGDRLARDLAYVRSYRLKDGLLFMSLMADRGILEWEPVRD
ncbi:MAG: META domain-containing protein [Rhodospirillales bacterium]|nr:MAG: META domain-containing protein [Rhodospirillales bacterium]